MRRVVAIAATTVAGVLTLAVLVIVVLVATGTAKLYAIPSSAMEPTLHCARPAAGCEAGTKDRVFAFTRFVSYERGDLVVFETTPEVERKCGSGGTFVKRIVGLPGETVETRTLAGKQYVYVDDRRLAEPYIEDERRPPGLRGGAVSLQDEYFVLGDNRAQSCDSSVWGPLPAGTVKGKLVGTYWPPDRWTIR